MCSVVTTVCAIRASIPVFPQGYESKFQFAACKLQGIIANTLQLITSKCLTNVNPRAELQNQSTVAVFTPHVLKNLLILLILSTRELGLSAGILLTQSFHSFSAPLQSAGPAD